MPSGTQFEAWVIAVHLVAKVSVQNHAVNVAMSLTILPGRSKDGLYEPALADSEREAVADLLGYLENVRPSTTRSTLQEILLTS